MAGQGGGIRNCLVPAGQLLAAAAREIVALERARLPDLSGLTVLLPNLHAAGEMGRALRDAAGAGTLLLPRFDTLKSFAEQTDPDVGRLPPSRRQAMIYQALRERDWFRQADLWHVSAELLRLFDEMTLSQVSLPSSYEAFLHGLEQAYRAGNSRPMQFEARLVHALWHAMCAGSENELDDGALYQLRLAQLAENPTMPLYVIGLAELVPLERSFLELYGRCQRVSCFAASPEGAEPGSLSYLLESAWADPELAESLPARVLACGGAASSSPIRQVLALYAFHNLEEEAGAVAFHIGQWLARGKKSILVVAQDRLVARRVRALLERAGVLVADETGWTLSTTSASTVVMRWLDSLDSRFHYQDLLDLLKSPFIFSGREPARRRHGVFRLEQLIRQHGVVSHLNRFRALAGDEEEVTELLDALAGAQKLLDKRRPRPLTGWLAGLFASLDRLQILASLQRDLAGEQLLQLLQQLGRELAQDATLFRYTEWRQWLNQQLEAAVFRDDSIASPVVFSHLAASRLRHFDGVIIAGADASHLPGKGRESVFFNQTVRSELGLPSRKAALAVERQDLVALLSSCPDIVVTWQERKNGEPNPLSPWFERLDMFHLLAYGESLKAAWLNPYVLPCAERTLPLSAAPAPVLPPERVPATLSASGYNSLIACPYQFYARHALHLNELDEVTQTLEKRDYGEYVHDILHRFHRAHPLLTGSDLASLEQELGEISSVVFARAIEADFVSHAWKLRWESHIPAYLRWQLERERQGWCWQAGEMECTLAIPLENGRELVLRGRLDRVDRNGNGLAVLDYKTQGHSGLKKKLETPGEDVQLACYALLLGEMPQQAAFVAVDEKETRQVEGGGDLAQLAEANRERLQAMFSAFYQGASLPAQGVAKVCEYCEMRGLCRKDYWNA